VWDLNQIEVELDDIGDLERFISQVTQEGQIHSLESRLSDPSTRKVIIRGCLISQATIKSLDGFGSDQQYISTELHVIFRPKESPARFRFIHGCIGEMQSKLASFKGKT
jgi:hypothetical protein